MFSFLKSYFKENEEQSHGIEEEITSLMTNSTLMGSLEQTINASNPTEDDGSIEKSCPNCQSNDVSINEGTYNCNSCFAQLSCTVDSNGEWKSYNNDSGGANPRCSVAINPFLPQTSCNTFIKSSDKSYNQRYRQLTSWSIPHSEKSLNGRLHDISYYGTQINLPSNVVDFGKQIYVEFVELQPLYRKKKSSRGDCHISIIAVCLLTACKEFNLPRSPDEICESIGINGVDYTKADNLFFCVMQYSKLIDISKHQYIIRSRDYINRFCRIMGIDDMSTINLILKIEQKINDLKIVKKNTPQAVACGCIYFVAKMRNLKIDKHDFDRKCNVSLPTLSKVYDSLIEYTDLLI